MALSLFFCRVGNHDARIPHLQPRWFLGCGPVQERELIQKDEQLAEVTKEAAQAAETNKQLEVQVSGSGCQLCFSSLMPPGDIHPSFPFSLKGAVPTFDRIQRWARM